MERRLTALGWMVAAEAVLLLSCRWWPAELLPVPVATVLGVAMALVLAVGWWAPGRRLRRLDGSWQVAGSVPQGEEVAVGAVLAAPGGAPPLALHATDPTSRREGEVVRLRAIGPALVRPTWSVRFPRRGVVRLPALAVVCDQPFGVVAARRTLGGPAEVVVLPPLGAVRRGFGQRLESWLGGHEGQAAAGLDELDHLRAYRPGDQPRSVHWRASARAGTLLVAERQDLVSRRLAVVLDTTGNPGRRFELLVCAAATAIDALCRAGFEPTLHGSFAGGTAGTAGDCERLLATLALAEPDRAELLDQVPPGRAALCLCWRKPAVAWTPAPLCLDLDDCETLMQLPRRVSAFEFPVSSGRLPARSRR